MLTAPSGSSYTSSTVLSPFETSSPCCGSPGHASLDLEPFLAVQTQVQGETLGVSSENKYGVCVRSCRLVCEEGGSIFEAVLVFKKKKDILKEKV